MKKTFIFVGLGIIFILAGCQNSAKTEVNNSTEANASAIMESANANEQNVDLANPASSNCIAKGGILEIRKNKNGEYGVCIFEDNRQCEEWALLRGNCPEGGVKITGYESDAEIYCAITGGEVMGTHGEYWVVGLGTQTPLCKRIDGTLCAIQANFDGDCPDPNDPNPNAGNTEAL